MCTPPSLLPLSFLLSTSPLSFPPFLPPSLPSSLPPFASLPPSPLPLPSLSHSPSLLIKHYRKVNARLKAQVDKLWHTTNIYMHPGIHEYAKKLTAKLPGDLKVSPASFLFINNVSPSASRMWY